MNAPSGSPLIDRALSFMDCEVTRHLELESDHRVYVGLVRSAGLLSNGFGNRVQDNGQTEPGGDERLD